MGPLEGETEYDYNLRALKWFFGVYGHMRVGQYFYIPYALGVSQELWGHGLGNVVHRIRSDGKYKGKRDQFSREAMSRETMALYKKAGTNPMSSCLPLLLQMPIFFGLFSVLNDAQSSGKAGVGLMTKALAEQFSNASLFGIAPLHSSFQAAMEAQPQEVAVMVIAAVMVVLMTGSQFITQLQIVSKNMSEETKASPTFRQQRILLYILPLVFAFSGFTFPIGVMFYWLASNFWTMGQQFLVIRNMPSPGSQAAKALEERLARRGKLTRSDVEIIEIEEKRPQRQQPIGKNRSKKKGR
jgi:YidC/Oxa1 family membrane protein insertase